MLTIAEADFKRLVGFIKSQYGINLTKKRVLIEGRLSNLILERGFLDFHTYLEAVFQDRTGREMTTLLNRLTTNHTYFMREPEHFDFFRDTVLPYIESVEKGYSARVWCAGCSTGEEPYTLEMILKDHFGGRFPKWNTRLLATDISERALSIAKEGKYTADSLDKVPAAWRLRYFEPVADGSRVRPEVKNDVEFRSLNLMLKQFPLRQKFHVIFCRNVMIYFEQETKTALVNRFYEYLESGGYLFIGHSESVDRKATAFQYIKPAVYRKE